MESGIAFEAPCSEVVHQNNRRRLSASRRLQMGDIGFFLPDLPNSPEIGRSSAEEFALRSDWLRDSSPKFYAPSSYHGLESRYRLC